MPQLSSPSSLWQRLTLRSTGRATAFVARASFHSGPGAARCRTPVSFTLGRTVTTMHSTNILIAAVLALSSLTTNVSAQSSPRAAVVVAHTGDDVVGQRVAFELREGIRASQAMRLVTEAEANPRFTVHMVSQDESSNAPGVSSNIAITFAYDANDLPHLGYFITTYVQSCGTNRTQQCARNLLSHIDRSLEKLRRELPQQYLRLTR